MKKVQQSENDIRISHNLLSPSPSLSQKLLNSFLLEPKHRKKNNGVVAVISDLTNEQAAQLTKEIIKAKRKVAPKGKSIL